MVKRLKSRRMKSSTIFIWLHGRAPSSRFPSRPCPGKSLRIALKGYGTVTNPLPAQRSLDGVIVNSNEKYLIV